MGKEESTRAGEQALSLIADPLTVGLLEALADEPRSLLELLRATGLPPKTTARARLRTLAEVEILSKGGQNGPAGTLDYELTDPGRELLDVAAAGREWLAAGPEGSMDLDSVPGKSAIKALVEAWSTGMLRVLAARPLSLTELDRALPGVSYPSLERRLTALRLTGLVVQRPGPTRGSPHVVTDWMRRAIAPLAIAARWERRHLRDMASPVTNRDVEAAFLLAVPLLDLPADSSGSFRLTVEVPAVDGRGLAGVFVAVEAGRIVSCSSRLEGRADAWASGPISVWLRATIESDPEALETGGDRSLVDGFIAGFLRAREAAARRA